jgi:hypothetical protein
MPVINGKSIAWANLEFAVIRPGGQAKIVADFQSVSYDDTANGVVVQAAGYMPHSRTQGQYTPGSMSIDWLSHHYDRFASEMLEGQNVPGLSLLDFMLQINRRYFGDSAVDFHRLYFSFAGASESASSGAGDALVTTTPCLLLKVERWYDGKLVVS